MSLSAIPRALRELVAARDEARCRYCGLRQVGQAAVFHVDHVIPRSRGGMTVAENLALQCPACSLHKASKTHAVDPLTRTLVLIFHPLTDDWAEHFVLRPDGSCAGLTPIGRATVDALAMNDPLPKVARAMQLAARIL